MSKPVVSSSLTYRKVPNSIEVMISIPVEYIHDVYDAIGNTSKYSRTEFFKGSVTTAEILENLYYSIKDHVKELENDSLNYSTQ
jgi:predicted translin family RNA/ssDNA-binding protein